MKQSRFILRGYSADVVIVGTATLDIDTLLAANFLFA